MQVECDDRPLPLGLHTFQTTQQKLSQAEVVLDDCETPFPGMTTLLVQILRFLRPHLLGVCFSVVFMLFPIDLP